MANKRQKWYKALKINFLGKIYLCTFRFMPHTFYNLNIINNIKNVHKIMFLLENNKVFHFYLPSVLYQ